METNTKQVLFQKFKSAEEDICAKWTTSRTSEGKMKPTGEGGDTAGAWKAMEIRTTETTRKKMMNSIWIEIKRLIASYSYQISAKCTPRDLCPACRLAASQAEVARLKAEAEERGEAPA